MTTADRLLEVLGDSVARKVLRALTLGDATQSELVRTVGQSQSTVSRALERLRLAGLLIEGSGRGQLLEVRGRDEVIRVLAMADRLAEALIRLDAEEQEEQSNQTRKASITPVSDVLRASQ